MASPHYVGPLLVAFYTVIGGFILRCPSQVAVFVFTGAIARTELAGLSCLSVLRRNRGLRIPGMGHYNPPLQATHQTKTISPLTPNVCNFI
jgi:hypothetical protein